MKPHSQTSATPALQTPYGDDVSPERDAEPCRTVTIRGRPIGLRPARFGVDLIAVERGYFPVSTTGYRSWSVGLSTPREDPLAGISPEDFEKLARDQDKERREVIQGTMREPADNREPLSAFISAYSAAEKALNDGFFAPDTDRAALWTGAFRLLSRIDSDRKLQPVPDSRAWTEELCAGRLAHARSLLGFLERLGRGDFTRPDFPRFYCGHSYFELPPRPGGEPRFLLPKLTREFAMEIPLVPNERPPAIARAPERPSEPAPETGAQMTLF